MDRHRSGLILALLAYLLWGLNPIYWKALRHLHSLEITLHRVVWSTVFLLGVVVWRRRLTTFFGMIRSPKTALLLAVNALLLGFNWGLYVWAVNAGKVVETSLGYFILPLLMLALGSALFREPLSRRQWIAVGLAASGVGLMILQSGTVPWVALTLAVTFATYSAIRKSMHASETLPTSTWEVVILSVPAAGAILAWFANPFSPQGIPYSGIDSTLLILSGVVTATPLVLYMEAAKRIRLSTLGFAGYLSPSMQFLLGIFLYREPFGTAEALAFGFLWAGLGLYSTGRGGTLPAKLVDN